MNKENMGYKSSINFNDLRSEILDKFGNTQKKTLKNEKGTPKFEEIEMKNNNSLIDDRSEINGKFDNNEESKKHSDKNNERRKNVEVKLEDTIALNNVIDNVSNIKLNEEDKRTELNGKINKKNGDKFENKVEVDGEKEVNIKVEDNILEDEDDKIQETTENVSLAMVIIIVISCLVIGANVGYILYRIALNG